MIKLIVNYISDRIGPVKSKSDTRMQIGSPNVEPLEHVKKTNFLLGVYCDS